ncbi:MAG: GNAT family N-acetyltransferase [Leptolyngbya sp. PLA1]|nr:GNAT family N-acetyltransferase [Leptolyngbya sp. PLA1]
MRDAPGSIARVGISSGAHSDLEALRRFHYCSGRPSPPVLVLRARVGRELAGVLVVSMPTLNGWWRRDAFGPAFGSPGRASAGRLNAAVRLLSRVIVDPRYRGLGVGAALVRAYLARPLTRYTEAVAGMGAFCPLFTAAGMREVPLRTPARDARLARALRALGLSAHTLADPVLARVRLRGSATLRRSVRAWAASSRATRARAAGPLAPLLHSAISRQLAPPRVYVFDAERPSRAGGDAWNAHESGGSLAPGRSPPSRNRSGRCPERPTNCTPG